MIDINLKQKYIQTLYKEKAFLVKEKPFTLHHGGESHLFLNHSIFLSKIENLSLLTDIYQNLIPKEIISYKLASVDSVMSPVITGILSSKLNKDLIIVKEKKTEHGLENKIYGNVNGEVILIDDVTSTGTILVNAALELRKNGAIVRFAIISACRDNTALDNLKKAYITPLYVATYEEIINELWNTLTISEKNIIKTEIKNKNYIWQLPSN